MKHEWDEAKNRKNLAKHGLSFEDAEQVFSGPCVTFKDDRFAYGEERLSLWVCSPEGWSSWPTHRAMRERGSSP
jgi:uncharacterized DUF497 family protein